MWPGGAVVGLGRGLGPSGAEWGRVGLGGVAEGLGMHSGWGWVGLGRGQLYLPT